MKPSTNYQYHSVRPRKRLSSLNRSSKRLKEPALCAQLRRANGAINGELSARTAEVRLAQREALTTKHECESCRFNHFSDLNQLRSELRHQKEALNPLTNTENLSLLQILDNRLQAFDAASASVKAIYARLTPEQKEALSCWFNGGLCTIRELADNDAVIQLRRSLAEEASRPRRARKEPEINLMELLEME